MHTLQLQLNDDLYENLTSRNIDISGKIKEYLLSLANDGYPAITSEEAKRRVKDAVERYKSGNGVYVTLDANHVADMDKFIESL